MQRLLVSLLVLVFATGLAACATPYNKPQTTPRIGEESPASGGYPAKKTTP